MAEAFGVVASALAVTELSAKVIQLCGKYWGAVRHAKEDIDRVIKEVKSVKEVVDNLEILLKGTGGTKLSTSQKLRDALGECRSQLESLEGRLAPSSTRRLMNRFRINDLKWPFENEDVEKILQGLSRCTQSLTAALQIDQTGIVLEIDANVVTIDQNIVIGKLPIAEGAAFDSHAEEHNPTCLPNTRGQLLNDIYHWIEDSEAKPVFWLNGMAGTGKSTISRTLARHTYEKGQLGASFFFKRGEGGRGGASKFFTTITAQLVHQMPALTPHVKDAIDKSHNIFDKALEEQFKKLILEPLSKTHIPSSRAAALVIIIDALDECDPDQDVRQIIHILSGANSSASLRLRIFLTSRPELPIRLGFRQVEGKYQKLILHEIEESIVEHDLSVYFEYELARVKEKHNALRRDQQIPSVWPDRSEIQTLTTMAMPLFIFAATVCRFIGDQRNGYPDKKLRKVLEYQTKSLGSNLDATYLPVLDQLLTDLCDSDKDEVLRLFKHLVGPIVLLESPLSVSGLASLLGISQADIDSHLDLLHSVLNVPLSPSSPVRLFHLSFRDFLIDPSKRGKNPFWIDEKEAHKQLAADCIRLMSETLRRNICNLEWPGAVTDSVKPEIILDKLPLELQYACQYWTYHVQHADLTLHDDDQVHRFLQQHFLHWLEALSLIGKFSEGQQGFRELSSLLRSEGCSQLSLFIDQALQFMIKHFVKLNDAPLQSYYTPLARESEKSTLRASFHRDVPDWILIAKGHDKYVGSLAFSPDGTIIASRLGYNDCIFA